jgi:hypothetical protein
VLLGDPDVGWTFPMRWNSRGYNIVFSRKKVGIWEMDGGGLTWTDENPDGAPGWWRLPGSGEDIRDRRPTGVNRGNIF